MQRFESSRLSQTVRPSAYLKMRTPEECQCH